MHLSNIEHAERRKGVSRAFFSCGGILRLLIQFEGTVQQQGYLLSVYTECCTDEHHNPPPHPNRTKCVPRNPAYPNQPNLPPPHPNPTHKPTHQQCTYPLMIPPKHTTPTSTPTPPFESHLFVRTFSRTDMITHPPHSTVCGKVARVRRRDGVHGGACRRGQRRRRRRGRERRRRCRWSPRGMWRG